MIVNSKYDAAFWVQPIKSYTGSLDDLFFVHFKDTLKASDEF